MIMPAPPITFTQPSSRSQSAPSSTSSDFMRLLIAQMANPDVSSLFSSTNDNDNSDPFSSFYSSSDPLANLYGSSSSDPLASLYSSSSNPLASLYSQTTATSGLTLQMEMSIWSNLIGKTVEAPGIQTGTIITGEVKAVILDQTTNTVKLDVEGTLVDPNSVTKVN